MKRLFVSFLLMGLFGFGLSEVSAQDLKSILSGVAKVVGNKVTGSENSIEGTWTFVGPDCKFESDNLLAKAGGEVAAKKVEDGIEETLTYCDFPSEHWTRIRTNNVIERLNREIRRRTRVVGSFPDGNSALMLVCARLRHVAGTQWGNKKYMNMKHLEAAIEDVSIAG